MFVKKHLIFEGPECKVVKITKSTFSEILKKKQKLASREILFLFIVEKQ